MNRAPKNSVLSNRLLIRRITSLKSITNTKREIVGYKAECNHNSPPEVKVFPLSQWGSIAYELAEDWALNHKCRGDYNTADLAAARYAETEVPARKLRAISR